MKASQVGCFGIQYQMLSCLQRSRAMMPSQHSRKHPGLAEAHRFSTHFSRPASAASTACILAASCIKVMWILICFLSVWAILSFLHAYRLLILTGSSMFSGRGSRAFGQNYILNWNHPCCDMSVCKMQYFPYGHCKSLSCHLFFCVCVTFCCI